MTDWIELSRRAGVASHRLVGWIYWDPVGIDNYAALGIPDGLGYYVATRAAPLGVAGNEAVTAAFYSINGDFVAMSLDLCREHTTFEATAAARDAAVSVGLSTYAPEIVDGLIELNDPLWAAADSLSPAGRVLFAAHRQWARPDDPLVSAWLAVNCIREWRGDTHWAVQIAEDLGETAVGILDGAWRGYADDWLPRSRGADDAALAAGIAELEARGLARDGAVTPEGVQYRQGLEDRLDGLCSAAWRELGVERTTAFLDLIEPIGARLVERIDETAGPNWMPAARDRPG
ncbi:MAG: SCO6745 family protein [Acidimicrobiales bacterium]